MKIEVSIDPLDIARHMAADGHFGPAVLEAFLAEISKRPASFVRNANTRACRGMTARELRALAAAFDASNARAASGYSAFV